MVAQLCATVRKTTRSYSKSSADASAFGVAIETSKLRDVFVHTDLRPRRALVYGEGRRGSLGARKHEDPDEDDHTGGELLFR